MRTLYQAKKVKKIDNFDTSSQFSSSPVDFQTTRVESSLFEQIKRVWSRTNEEFAQDYDQHGEWRTKLGLVILSSQRPGPSREGVPTHCMDGRQ